MPEDKQDTKDKGGRPTLYTDDLVNIICDRLSDGMSLRTVCRSDDMPCKATVLDWIKNKEGFLDQYTRAKTESADALVDEMLDIADDATNDWMIDNIRGEEAPGYKLMGEHINRSRLRLDTRKWIAARMQPKKYGERIEQNITATTALTDLSLDELNQKLKEIELEEQRSRED